MEIISYNDHPVGPDDVNITILLDFIARNNRGAADFRAVEHAVQALSEEYPPPCVTRFHAPNADPPVTFLGDAVVAAYCVALVAMLAIGSIRACADHEPARPTCLKVPGGRCIYKFD